jgi:hypothetical protein
MAKSTKVSAKLATLLHSLQYDTMKLMETTPGEAEKDYGFYLESRKKLIDYLGTLEGNAGIVRDTPYFF